MLGDLIAERRSFTTAAPWSFVAAGTLATTTGAYALWPIAPEERPGRPGIGLVPGPSGATLVIRGTF